MKSRIVITTCASSAVFTRISVERERQRQLLRDGKIKFDCSSPVVCNDRKLRVDTEELGEVARAIDLLENAKTPAARAKARKHLQDELTQLAAVNVAWLESFEQGESAEVRGGK